MANRVFEFASVANAVFPFDRCAASAGDSRWDSNLRVWLRVYDLAEPLKEVTARIEERGMAEVQRLTKMKGNIQRSQHGKWSEIMISYWWSPDPEYPLGLYFDCYAQQVNGRTLVFCFIYQSKHPHVAEILNSVDFRVGK
jgi:hypothetical protein